jgi:phosphoglycolate phosphatase
MIKAVILDLDDTLLLTEEACFYMEDEVLVKMGRKPMGREIHKQTWGQALFDAIAVRSPGVDVAEFKEMYRPVIATYTAAGKFDVPEENIQTLDELANLGKTLYIVTSREYAELEKFMDAEHHLASRVKMFYHKENMKHRKPDPRAFDELFAHTGYTPEECVYVGDSLTDAAAANGARIPFIASLESGLRSKEDFASCNVAAFVSTFPQIIDAVQHLES